MLSLCLFQTLLLLILQNSKICHANDLREPYDIERSYNGERSRYNRALGAQAQAEADAHAQANTQTFGGLNHGQTYAQSQANAQTYTSSGFNNLGRSNNNRDNGETNNVDKSENLRQFLMDYDTEVRPYENARNGDRSENIDNAAGSGRSPFDEDALEERSRNNRALGAQAQAKAEAHAQANTQTFGGLNHGQTYAQSQANAQTYTSSGFNNLGRSNNNRDYGETNNVDKSENLRQLLMDYDAEVRAYDNARNGDRSENIDNAAGSGRSPFDEDALEERSRNNRALGAQAQAKAEAHAQANTQTFGGLNHGQTYAQSQANAQTYTSSSFNNLGRSNNNRDNGETNNVDKSENLRQLLMDYDAEVRAYDNARNGDRSENIDNAAGSGRSPFDEDALEERSRNNRALGAQAQAKAEAHTQANTQTFGGLNHGQTYAQSQANAQTYTSSGFNNLGRSNNNRDYGETNNVDKSESLRQLLMDYDAEVRAYDNARNGDRSENIDNAAGSGRSPFDEDALEERSRNNRAFGAQTQAEAEAQAQANTQTFGGFNHGQTYAQSQANAQTYASGGFNNLGRSNNNRDYREPDNVGRSESLRQAINEHTIGARTHYDGTNYGDSSENIELAAAIGSSGSPTDGDDSTINLLTNNTLTNGDSKNLLKSSSTTSTSGADSCVCDGGLGASDEVSFLCFTIKDGGKAFAMKYKGITNFNLEDIVKAYKYYYDNLQDNNINFENNFNTENNFKHELNADNKLTVDLNKFKVNTFNESYLIFNTEHKFDTNEIKKNDNKFTVNTFENSNMNTFNKDSNKFNFDVTNNYAHNIDISKHLKDKNKINSHLKKKINGNFNFNSHANSKIHTLKKIKSLIKSSKNAKLNLKNDLNVNQYSLDSDMHADTQVQAKTFAQAKAIAKAQKILQARAEAKAQAVIQTQINAQAQAKAMAKAQVNSQLNVQNQVNTQAYVQTHAQAQTQTQNVGYQSNSQSQPISFTTVNNNAHPSNALNFGVGINKAIFGTGGFNSAFDGAASLGTFSSFSNQHGYKTGGNIIAGASAVSGVNGHVPFIRHAAAEDSTIETVPYGDYTAPVDSHVPMRRFYDSRNQNEPHRIVTPYGAPGEYNRYR